jgi:hypothetical protein
MYEAGFRTYPIRGGKKTFYCKCEVDTIEEAQQLANHLTPRRAVIEPAWRCIDEQCNANDTASSMGPAASSIR